MLRDLCSFMAGASSSSAGFLTYQHGARRAAAQRTRLYLPCPSELRPRLVQCGLPDRQGMQTAWTGGGWLLRFREVLAVGVLLGEHRDF